MMFRAIGEKVAGWIRKRKPEPASVPELPRCPYCKNPATLFYRPTLVFWPLNRNRLLNHVPVTVQYGNAACEDCTHSLTWSDLAKSDVRESAAAMFARRKYDGIDFKLTELHWKPIR